MAHSTTASRITTSLVAIVIVLVALAVLRYVSSAKNQQRGRIQNGKDVLEPSNEPKAEDIPAIFAREGGKAPSGNWLVGALPNEAQRLDRGVPVIVGNTMSLTASGKTTNLIVAGVTVLNRSSKPVRSIRLEWALIDVEDGRSLAKGYTPTFDINLGAGDEKKMPCPYINFAKISKPISKNGKLQGGFHLRVGVGSVSFVDGSVWRETEKPRSNHGAGSVEFIVPQDPVECPDELCAVGPEHLEAVCWLQPGNGSLCRLRQCTVQNGTNYCICDRGSCSAPCPFTPEQESACNSQPYHIFNE
jgi:hypothetical protein